MFLRSHGRGLESQQMRLIFERWKICCTVVIALHEAGGSVEESRDRGLRPDMDFQLSPLTQMLDWNRQSVSILATPSRTLKMQLQGRFHHCPGVVKGIECLTNKEIKNELPRQEVLQEIPKRRRPKREDPPTNGNRRI